MIIYTDIESCLYHSTIKVSVALKVQFPGMTKSLISFRNFATIVNLQTFISWRHFGSHDFILEATKTLLEWWSLPWTWLPFPYFQDIIYLVEHRQDIHNHDSYKRNHTCQNGW